MSRRSVRWMLLSVVLALALVPAGAEVAGGDQGHHPPGHARLDERFVVFNTQSNLFEIRAGTLAQQRAASADVKAFGQMLVTDHTAQQQQLAGVAAQLGIAVPSDVSPRQAAILAHLATLTGAAFDRAFLKVQVLAHLKAIRFNVIKGTDPRLSEPLAELAIAGSPVLVRHLRHARVLLAATS